MTNKIRVIKTFVNEPDNLETEFLSSIREYNERGLETRYVEYSPDNKIEFEHIVEFDNKNNPIKEETISHSEDYSEKKFITYDEKGRILEEKTEYQEGWLSVKKFERDSEKRCLKVVVYDEDDEIEEFNEYYYNEKGDIVSQVEKDENDKQKSKIINTFNDEGILIMKEEYLDSKKPEKIHRYYYNDVGNLNALQTVNAKERVLDWVKVLFDEQNRPIEQNTMSGAKITIEYLDDEKVTIEKHLSPNGEIINQTKIFRNSEGLPIREETGESIKRFEYEYF